MTLKILYFFVIGFPFFGLTAQYDREKCDQLINIDKYLVAGSMANDSAGGKTYSFKRIVGALQNELHGGAEPRAKHFECYKNLYEKAHNDAFTYWTNRLATSACADSTGGVPKVQPDNCDNATWNEFHRSMGLLTKSRSDIAELAQECIESDGVRSCEARSGMQNLKTIATPLAAAQMDSCCDMKSGSAFRVLRGFYTFEFSHMPDAELQKECYKRTRPNTKSALDTGLSSIGSCVRGVVAGIIESFKKLLSSVNSLANMGTLTEIWRLFGKAATLDFKEIGTKLALLFKAIVQQVAAQVGSMSCFTGKYAADHVCKLTSSIATDWFIGAKAVQGIKMLAKALTTKTSAMASLAKEMIEGSPKQIKAMKAKATAATQAAKTKVSAAAGTVRSASSTARTAAAAKLTSMGKSLKNFKQDLSKAIVEARIKTGQAVAGNNNLVRKSPNASTTIEVPKGGIHADIDTSKPLAAAANTANKVTSIVKLTDSSAQKIIDNLRPFRRARAHRKNPELAFVDAKQLKGKTNTEKLKIIEDAAETRRAQVNKLAQADHAKKITEKTAKKMLANIDAAIDQVKKKFGASTPTLGSSASSVGGSRLNRAAPDQINNRLNEAPEGIDITPSSTPTAGSTSTASAGSAGVSVATSNTTAQAFSSIPKYSVFDAIQPGFAMPKALEKTWNNLSTYINKTQNVGSTSVKNSVYGNISRRGITRESLQRHREVEEMFRKGIIDAENANAIHNIIATTEKLATGTVSKYSTNYIVSPNASLSTFSAKKAAAAITIRSTIGAGLTNRQIEKTSDSGTNQRYSSEAIRSSVATWERLSATPTVVRKEFDTLKTEQEVLDRADELRTKIKTVEINFGSLSEESRRNEIADLLVKIDTERDRALNRIKGIAEPIDKAATPSPIVTRPPAALPEEESAPTISPPTEQELSQ